MGRRTWCGGQWGPCQCLHLPCGAGASLCPRDTLHSQSGPPLLIPHPGSRAPEGGDPGIELSPPRARGQTAGVLVLPGSAVQGLEPRGVGLAQHSSVGTHLPAAPARLCLGGTLGCAGASGCTPGVDKPLEIGIHVPPERTDALGLHPLRGQGLAKRACPSKGKCRPLAHQAPCGSKLARRQVTSGQGPCVGTQWGKGS